MDLPRLVASADDAAHADQTLIVDVLHELRSPLTVVGGRVFQLKQQLRRGETDPAQLAAKLDEISKATNLMAAALEQLAARAAYAD
jgi:signal transduction histidine kinase